MNASRLLLLIPLSLISLGLPMHAQATGFNFWEGSALNSALANANGAKARDASVQAMVPASITQLKIAHHYGKHYTLPSRYRL